MAYTELGLTLIRSGKEALYTLFDLIRTNFNDHESRISTLEADSGVIPPGMIFAYGAGTVPTGYLECKGDSVSRTTYAALFAIFSTTYNTGGEAGTDFRLPDLRGRAPIGIGSGGSLTTRTLGEISGTETVVVGTGEMPSHTHSTTDPGHQHTFLNEASGGVGYTRVTDINTFQARNTSASSTGISIANTGGGGAHANMQPSKVVEYIVKI